MRLSLAVGLGLFFGILPVWGLQTVLALTLAHRLRLNLAITLLACNISLPPMVPFLLYAGTAVGHWLFTGELLSIALGEMTMARAREYRLAMARGQPATGGPRRGAGNLLHLHARAAASQEMKPNLYTRMYLWLVARRPLVLITVLLLSVAGVVISLRIDLEEDILDMLPRNDERVDDYRYALRKFRQIDRLYLDVSVGADDPEKLARAADEVFAALSANTNFVRIVYRIEMGNQGRAIDFLTGALPNLFTEADARELEQKLEPSAVREHLTAMRRKLAGPEGMLLKEVVAADPIGSSALVVAKVLPLQTGFGGAQLVDGRITSGDGRHVLITAEPKFRSSDSRASTALVQALLREARDVEQRFPGVHVAITGGHRMSVDNASIIRADAKRCIAIGTVAMLALCLMAYRRRWLALVTFLPSFFGTLMAGVVLAVWQDQLSAIALGFASIAIGVTVDYAIHVIYHLDDTSATDHPSIGRHLSKLVFPVGVGVLTTIGAFLVMMGSPLHGYQQLGILGAIGVIFSAAFALVILPLLVPPAKITGQPPLWLTSLWERYFKWQSHRRLGLLAFVLVLTVVRFVRRAAASLRRGRCQAQRHHGIHAIGRPVDQPNLGRRARPDDGGRARRDSRRGADPKRSGGRSPRPRSQRDRAVFAVRRVSRTGNAGGEHPPLAASSGRRRNRRRSARHCSRSAANWVFAATPSRSSGQRLEGEPALLTLDTFRGTPLEQALTERVARGPDATAVSTLVKLENRAEVGKVREALPGLIVLDGQDFAAHIAGLARQGLEHFAIWTGIIVGALLLLSLASVELVVVTLVPIAFGLLWTFGVMGWLGIPIDLMNSIFVIFIIGVGEDYSVFMVTSKLDEWRGRPHKAAVTSASVLVSALTTIFGFGVMVIADHPVLFSMGATVLIGMVFTFIATLLLTPLCMDLLLFKNPPRGAPRWWHPLVTLWVILHLGGSQVFLYYVLRPILKLLSPRTADDRLRRATRWMARGVVKMRAVRQTGVSEHNPRNLFPALHCHQQSPVGRGRDVDREFAGRRAADGEEARVRRAHARHRLPVAGPRDGRAERSRNHAATLPRALGRRGVRAFLSGRHAVAGRLRATVSSRRLRAGRGIEAGHSARRALRRQHRDAARCLLV